MSAAVTLRLPRPSHARLVTRWLVGVSAFAYLLYLLWLFDFVRIFTGLPKLWVIVRLMIDWSRFREWDHAELLRSMVETVAMAFLGTFLATIFALPLGFLGARDVVPNKVFRFLTRRIFDGCRGLDQFIWALVFVRAVGLGPIAGVLAIMVAETGVLAKLFAEAIENIDTKQVDGIRSTGASRIAELRYGVLPQILPVLISQALYSIEFELPRSHHPGVGRRRRDRAAVVGAHSDQRLGPGGVRHRADLDHRGDDRLAVAVATAAVDRWAVNAKLTA